MKRLRLKQPATKRKVLEYVLDGWAGWSLHVLTGFDGQTFALPFLRVILYFGREPSAYLRVHEMTHVAQADRLTWIGLAAAYAWETVRHGYKWNRFEVEARAEQAIAREVCLPEWAE